jgi:hypothetical protein
MPHGLSRFQPDNFTYTRTKNIMTFKPESKPQGFSPNSENKAKRAAAVQPIAAPTIPDEQKDVDQANIHESGIQRLQDAQSASSAMVQSLMNAAQRQAMFEAQAIAAYPQLVANLTAGYLEQMGVDLGKPRAFVVPEWEAPPEMEMFQAALLGQPLPKQLRSAE